MLRETLNSGNKKSCWYEKETTKKMSRNVIYLKKLHFRQKNTKKKKLSDLRRKQTLDWGDLKKSKAGAKGKLKLKLREYS